MHGQPRPAGVEIDRGGGVESVEAKAIERRHVAGEQLLVIALLVGDGKLQLALRAVAEKHVPEVLQQYSQRIGGGRREGGVKGRRPLTAACCGRWTPFWSRRE
jgi:hypothetical protein